jgi:hypothetical protein
MNSNLMLTMQIRAGFNVHSQVRAQTKSEAERVGKGLGWVGVIRKVYEVDPLRCPACGGQMRIISFIEETKTIEGKTKS